jgi:hypothetical protein
MNLRTIIIDWFKRRQRIRIARQNAALARRRAAILDQIAKRKERHEEWRSKVGSLKDATTEKLRVENQLARM